VPAANGRQQLYPESADWLDCQQMGQSLMRAGEKEKAIVLFERAYNIAPGELETRHTEIRILLDKAKCLIELGRNKEALQCLTEATSSSRGIDALFKEAVDLKEQLLSSTSCDHSSSVSPWLDKTSIASPNGKITAVIAGAQEIGMGAPTSGVLNISNGLRFEDCNPSMVWSADSEYIAVPQWTTGRRQRLMIVSVSHRLHRYAPGTYRVLRLESFENGIVTGIDSPIHLPKQIQVDIASIRWG
jgi:tetratricopeptide (TPR) repeat protein